MNQILVEHFLRKGYHLTQVTEGGATVLIFKHGKSFSNSSSDDNTSGFMPEDFTSVVKPN